MSKGLRYLLIVATCLFAVGVILALAGFATGGMRAVQVGPDGFYIAQNGSKSGRLAEKISAFNSIDIGVQAYRITLKEGKEFSVSGNYDSAWGEPSIEVEDEKLVIRDYRGRNRRGLWNGLLQYGLHFTSNWDGWDQDSWSGLYMEITYPSETKFNDVKLDSDAADVLIDGMTAEKLTVSCDAGDLKIQNVETGYLDISLDAGSCDVKDVTSKKTEFDLDAGSFTAEGFITDGLDGSLSMGEASINGTLRGETDISAELGSITLKTTLPETDYSYALGVSLGDVVINGESRSGSSVERSGDQLHEITAKASMGSIVVEFTP